MQYYNEPYRNRTCNLLIKSDIPSEAQPPKITSYIPFYIVSFFVLLWLFMCMKAE